MAEDRRLVETHGCIVCGRLHSLLVVYSPHQALIGCAVTSPGGHRVFDPDRPLVACDAHPAAAIEAAYLRYQMAAGQEEADEDE